MEEKNKNTLHNNDIKAGGNVHIGDIIYQQSGKTGQLTGAFNGSIEEFVEVLHELVSRGKTKEAIPKLRQFTKTNNPMLHPAVLQLSDRWEAFERKSLMGRLSNSEQTVERAQITGDLLDLIGKLNEGE